MNIFFYKSWRSQRANSETFALFLKFPLVDALAPTQRLIDA